MAILSTKLKFLTGIGEKKAEVLQSELFLESFEDLLNHIPTRYIDRSRFYTIKELAGMQDHSVEVQIKAQVQHVKMVGEGRKARLIVTVYDGTAVGQMVWFQRASWILKHIDQQREYVFFGRGQIYQEQFQMTHPEFEAVSIHKNAITQSHVQGVYRVTEKVKNFSMGPRQIAQFVQTVWEKARGQVEETLPGWFIEKYGLMAREDALFEAHYPTTKEQLDRALYRLKFDELFLIQLNLLHKREVRLERSEAPVFEHVGERFNRFYKDILPFELTGAQKRVVREIRADTSTPRQMNRLVQGDVGSGKTIVALLAALLAADNGYQTALMAPTEILATQHYESLAPLCNMVGVSVALLTGSTRKKERERLHEDLQNGELDLLIGTHSLIEDPVQFKRLGLAIIDEQHRFGVMQRARLHTKGGGKAPHILVMTATPIPRTLAMTLYGDLDVSIIDELPPGRKPIKTFHTRENQRLRVMGFMAKEIQKGRQCYVVYPAVDENEKINIASVEAGAVAIADFFPPEKGYCSVVVHGKMTAKNKDYGMEVFRRGEAQILIATTVIEVGVNVPNASVMLIENAERFGLSQLHQLRGRVGRGAEQSWCILMTGDKLSRDTRERLAVMCESNDGFVIAEKDMELRGIGDIDGTRQSGQAVRIKFANLASDGAVLASARDAALAVLADDWELGRAENFVLRVRVATLRAQQSGGDLDLDLSNIS